MNIENKFDLQNNQYKFPYHHIPNFTGNEKLSLLRKLPWGHEYICYQQKIMDIIEAKKPKSILDVGCGDGYLLNNLTYECDDKLGIDLSFESILHAKAFSRNEKIFRVSDGNDLNMSYDIVIASEVLEHIPDDLVSTFFNTLFINCNTNGRILITVPTTNLPLNSKHFRHYNIGLFKEQLLNSNLKLRIEQFFYVYKSSFLMNLYLRLFFNKFWTLEIDFLNKIIWKYVKYKLKDADENNGHHLFVILSKNDK